MPISEQQKRVFDVAFASVGLLLAASGAIAGYAEFRASVHRDHVAYAMDYASAYNSDPIAEDVNAVDRLLRGISNQWAALPNGLTPEKRKAAQDRIVIFAIRDTDGESDSAMAVRRLLDFYDTVTTCANAGTCDKATTQRLFQANADHFFRIIHPYICEERYRWQFWSLEAGPEEFLERQSPAPVVSCKDVKLVPLDQLTPVVSTPDNKN